MSAETRPGASVRSASWAQLVRLGDLALELGPGVAAEMGDRVEAGLTEADAYELLGELGDAVRRARQVPP